jgi:hypothetical protein
MNSPTTSIPNIPHRWPLLIKSINIGTEIYLEETTKKEEFAKTTTSKKDHIPQEEHSKVRINVVEIAVLNQWGFIKDYYTYRDQPERFMVVSYLAIMHTSWVNRKFLRLSRQGAPIPLSDY